MALFPGSGTLAAATVGALGSVAAVAAGGVAILGGGVAAAAFKFSPSLSGEGSMSKEEREKKLQEIKKVHSNWKKSIQNFCINSLKLRILTRISDFMICNKFLGNKLLNLDKQLARPSLCYKSVC